MWQIHWQYLSKIAKLLEILEQCKGMLCAELGESFPTHIYLQNFASIQPRTSPLKFARVASSSARPETGRSMPDMPAAASSSRSCCSLAYCFCALTKALPKRNASSTVSPETRNHCGMCRLRNTPKSVPVPRAARRGPARVISPPNFERLVLGCVEADFCK